MNRCCNTEALSRYEDEQAKSELEYERYIEAIDEAIGTKLDELIELFNEVDSNYNYDYTIEQYVRER